MFPVSRFVSESAAADLLEQVRWRDGVECPRCRSDPTVRNGSYRVYQRYLCKNCGRTFNDKTGTMDSKSLLKPHVPLLVVTQSDAMGTNVMTAAWWMLAGYEPFRYLLSVDHKTHTYEILEENPEFVMGIPTVDLLDAVTLCGTTSGRDVDKVEQLGLDLISGTEVDVPLIADALGNIECRVDESFEFGNNTYYFGEVKAVHITPDAMDGRILSPSAGPLAYMGSDRDEDGEKHRHYLEYADELERFPDAAVEETLPSAVTETE